MTVLLGQLQHSPADIFRTRLINAGIGSIQGMNMSWPVIVDTELDLPDDTIVVTNSEGERFGRVQVSGEQPEHFGVQVKVRGTLSTAAWTKANQIAVAMDQQLSHYTVHLLANSSLGLVAAGYRIGAVTRKSGPLSVGREQGTKRFIYTINAIFVCHQVS